MYTDVHYIYTNDTQILEKLVGVEANFAGWPEKLPALLIRAGICHDLPPSYCLSREMHSPAAPQRSSGNHCCPHSWYRGTQVTHELWGCTAHMASAALTQAQLVPAHQQLVWVCLFKQQVSVTKPINKSICSPASNTQNTWHAWAYCLDPCAPNFAPFPMHLSIKKNHEGKGMAGMKHLKNAFNEAIKLSCWKL